MRRLIVFFALILGLTSVAFTASAQGPKAAHHAQAQAPQQDDPAPKTEAKGDAKPDAKADDADEGDGAAAGDTEEPKAHDPVTMKIGIVVEELNKLDLTNQTYQAVFRAIVRCDHDPCKPDLDIANGKFTGKPEKLHDEKLLKIFRVKAELSAMLDFRAYPFDSHALPIVLQDKGDPEQIKYSLDEETMDQVPNIRLPGWEIGESVATIGELDDGDGKKISQVQYYIEAKRPVAVALFNSIIPILIMMFTAAFTLLLKPKSAAGRLTTAVGGFSALVMAQVGQVTKLPALGYMTFFDKFMLASYVVYIANIAFSVAMVRFEEKKKERMSELMYLSACGAVPGLALMLWTYVFCFGLA